MMIAKPAKVVQFEKSLRQSKDPGKHLLALWLSLSEPERNKQFIDTASAAQLVGVSQRMIRLWIEAGWILAVHIGKKHRIHLDSLMGYLTSRVQE